MKSDPKNNKPAQTEKNDFPGYPHYSSNEDIYRQEKEETEIDPEQPDHLKTPVDKEEQNQKNFKKDRTGGDLDVPGSELDDEQENIGSEDEENNIYSNGDTN